MITDNKLRHQLSVARKMQKYAELLCPNNVQYANDMFFLGYIHDIGYEFSDNQENHSELGAMLLKSQGYEYWKEVLYHGKINVNYSSDSLNLLNYADLTTNSKGQYVSIDKRIEEIAIRYGEDSKQVKNAKKLKSRLVPFANKLYNLYFNQNKKQNIKKKKKSSKSSYNRHYLQISKSDIAEIVENAILGLNKSGERK